MIGKLGIRGLEKDRDAESLAPQVHTNFSAKYFNCFTSSQRRRVSVVDSITQFLMAIGRIK